MEPIGVIGIIEGPKRWTEVMGFNKIISYPDRIIKLHLVKYDGLLDGNQASHLMSLIERLPGNKFWEEITKRDCFVDPNTNSKIYKNKFILEFTEINKKTISPRLNPTNQMKVIESCIDLSVKESIKVNKDSKSREDNISDNEDVVNGIKKYEALVSETTNTSKLNRVTISKITDVPETLNIPSLIILTKNNIEVINDNRSMTSKDSVVIYHDTTGEQLNGQNNILKVNRQIEITTLNEVSSFQTDLHVFIAADLVIVFIYLSFFPNLELIIKYMLIQDKDYQIGTT